MLGSRDRSLLADAFAKGNLRELTLEQAASIAEQTKVPLRLVEWSALENGIVPCRYQRHAGCIGVAGQMTLLASRVIVVGLGGLGGHVSEQLARAGVGRITGVDPDVFDATNLNRQLLSEEGNLGSGKVDEAGKRLRSVNRAVEFDGRAVPLDQLPDDVFQNADLAFDCLDSFEDRVLLAKRCAAAGIPLVHGAIAGWCGEVCIVWPGERTLEWIYKRQGRGVEQDLGNPSFTAAAAASLMAAQGVKVLTGKTAAGTETILFFDLLDDEWQVIDVGSGGR